MCFPGDVLGAPYGQISGSEGFRGSGFMVGRGQANQEDLCTPQEFS